MLAFTRTLSRSVAPLTTREHVTLGGITVRLIVFVVALATWVLMARGRWDISEQIVVSLVVLIGFVAFTSAVHGILEAALPARRERWLVPGADVRGGALDDPDTLASILITHAPPGAATLTLAQATCTLVQQVGPLPMARVLRTMDVLARLHWCTPDYDERTEQQCWHLTAPDHGPASVLPSS